MPKSPRRLLLATGTVLVALLAVTGVRFVATAATATAAPAPAAVFTHPGVLLSRAQRPQGSNNLFVAWETLTHAGNPT